MKDQAWHDARLSYIGGSDAKRIMDGDWLRLWEEKTGKTPPDDLSGVLPVQLGSFTEPFNLDWFSRHTGIPLRFDLCQHVKHPDHPFIGANIDARTDGAIVEAKHVNAFSKAEEVIGRYYPQIQHYLAVTGEQKAYLSVIFGTQAWEFFTVERDNDYIERLIARECEFWRHVEANKQPHDPAPEVVKINLDDMREVDMAGNNAWAANAGDWKEHRDAAKKHEKATKELKALVEADVKLASGHGVKVTRAKNGSLTVREI